MLVVASQSPVIIKAAGPNAPVSTDIQAHTQANTHAGHAGRDTPLNTVNQALVL